MDTTQTQTQTPILLTVKGVAQTIQAGRSFIYQEVQAGRFPKPVKLGRSTRWIASEIYAWIAAKAQSRDQVTGGLTMQATDHTKNQQLK